MVRQLLVALVEPVGGSEEGNRVGDVNRDRHVQLPASIPHRVESRIVDLNQFSGGRALAQVEPESFENLEPARPAAVRLLDCLGLYAGIAGLEEA